MRKIIRKTKVFSIILALLLYTIIYYTKDSPSVPKVIDIANSLMEILSSAKFYVDLFCTIKLVLIGVLMAFLVGTCIAIICSMNIFLNNLIMPIINAIKNVPSIALFPLFIVLMGIGDAPRIFVIIWNSLYPAISSTMAGLNSIDSEVIESAKNCGATNWQLYRYIKIPLSFISILEGLKISVGNGFIAIVVAEMLGATQGLGYMILWSANAFQYSNMYAYILIIALVGFLMNAIIEKVIRKTERKMYYG